MTVLPSQKLSIGQLFISFAAGLMLFLLPNDLKNQFEPPVSEYCILFFTLIITLTLYFFLKRFEAVGVAILTAAVLIGINVIFNIINGIIFNSDNYWPTLTEYNIISMFFIWIVPFFCMTSLRILIPENSDTEDRCMGYARFLYFSMRALLILYSIVIIFIMIIPYKPNTDMPREIDFTFFSRIGDCISNIHEDGIKYILWHAFILLPMSFYLLVLIPKISWWQILIIAVALGFTIEVLQYSFNTGTACIDDILMYIIGAAAGILIKHSIDKVRSVLTFGQDECMLSLNYHSSKKKKSNNAFAVNE